MFSFLQRSIASGVLFVLLSVSYAQAAQKIVVYSGRKEFMDKPILEEFTKQTGIEVQLLNDDSVKLIARLQAEGKDTPADVALIVDSTNLINATNSNLLQPVESTVLNAAIPVELRDVKNRWFGIGKRARPIFYNKELVKPEQLSTYEDLADAKWKGKVIVSSSSKAYNLSLLSAMIAADGSETTQKWANGLVTNMARDPQGSDMDQIKAIAAGEGSVGFANTYYYARMLLSAMPEEREAAAKVGIFFPNQNAGKGQLQGAHINVTGAGVINGSKHAAEGQKLIEFLISEPIQRLYADSNQEYPVNAKVEPSPTLKSFGAFKMDTTKLTDLEKYNQEAVKVADRAGWK